MDPILPPWLPLLCQAWNFTNIDLALLFLHSDVLNHGETGKIIEAMPGPHFVGNFGNILKAKLPTDIFWSAEVLLLPPSPVLLLRLLSFGPPPAQ